jgi:drug/metabolite transporter (DMT)-like permease
MSWPWFALIAMGCFASMQLTFAYLTRNGLTPASILVFVFGVGWLLYVLHIVAFATPLPGRTSILVLLFTAGALGYVGNLAAVRAVALAPNPGYAVAIFGLQALVVTVVSMMLLGASLSWVKICGVLLCSAGVALLVI